MKARTFSAQRTFTCEDQWSFAELSGDRNPIHLDPLNARRTQAGAPVVHGIHLLLWSLNAYADTSAIRPPLRKLRVRFSKFVYVGEMVELIQSKQIPDGVKLLLSVGGTPVSQVVLEFGEPGPMTTPTQASLFTLPQTPLDIDFDSLSGYAGRLPFASSPKRLADLFPALAAWVTPSRVAALAASTNLVGMVCPGLHSIYGGLTVEANAVDHADDALDFRVVATDPRFRLIRIWVQGGGLCGTLESFARVPPISQATMASLAGAIGCTEFAGAAALVVGGSRGIGEITAKLLAAGGARVTITYHVGRSDAENVAREIRAAGGQCDMLPYDAHRSAETQVANLAETPTHLYYFATPIIFGRQADSYSRKRLDTFLDVYVDGFARLVHELRERRANLAVFYPSSAAVDARPRGMTEYAMAKASGELLCAEMNQTLAPLHVSVIRLPRMTTDQTATFMPVEEASVVKTMLTVVREVQSWPKQDT